MAAAAHRQVRGAFGVVANKGDEATVAGERRVHLGRNHRLNFGAECIVAHQTLNDWCLRLVRVTHDETRGRRVVERGILQKFATLGRNNDLQRDTVGGVGAHFVGECGFRDHFEAEVVAKLVARLTDDLKPQPKAIGVGFGVAQRS